MIKIKTNKIIKFFFISYSFHLETKGRRLFCFNGHIEANQVFNGRKILRIDKKALVSALFRNVAFLTNYETELALRDYVKEYNNGSDKLLWNKYINTWRCKVPLTLLLFLKKCKKP